MEVSLENLKEQLEALKKEEGYCEAIWCERCSRVSGYNDALYDIARAFTIDHKRYD